MRATPAAAVALAIVLAGCSLPSRRAEREERAAPPSTAPTTSPQQQRSAPRSAPAVHSYADVVDRTTPAVVTIRSARRVRAPQQFPFFDDPLFEQFFGRRVVPRQAPEQQQLGLGSGVIVRNDGYTLTNHHVVDGAEEITIEMPNRRTYRADLVGSDAPSDLAVLRINASDLPTLHLGNSDDVRVGDLVLAIGNPLGIGQTVTMGIISAKGRATGLSDGSFEDFLQTDAPINRGNSGGALVNTNGDLIGINSQILSPTGANIGIGFAIPSNMARNVMDQLVRNKRVRRGGLGVSIGLVTSEIAQKLGLREPRGIFIAQVVPAGAAAAAGLREGDVIVAFNGEPVTAVNDFRIRVSSTPPGTEVTLTILRGGREQNVRVRLGELRG
ncbi:MAG TPA: Do family serine endopeptidase [Bryobacteraceae bacterium]|nr:Do family serine endopeptidase [Bryobacteraceae bacterium]